MISILVLAFILIVALLLFLALGAVAVKMNPKGESDMIKKVYIYLVLFATLMMTIGGGVALFMSLADIIAPTYYNQTFEEYKMMYTDKGTTGTTIPEEQLRASYDRMIADNNARQVDRAKNSLVKSLGWIIIPLPIFIYFQRKLNRSE